MSTSYIVTYSHDAGADVPTKIESRLRSLGLTSVVRDAQSRRIYASYEDEGGGQDCVSIRRDLSSLQNYIVSVRAGKLNKALSVGNKWNIAFSNMLRQTDAAAWANWDLNADIKAGAVGILDIDSGSFTYVATLQDATIIDNVSYEAWEMESASASFGSSNVEFEGGYLDPSSGEEVNVGLQAAWTFEAANSIVSRATISGRTNVDNYGVLLKSPSTWNWLVQQAESVGYGNNENGINQGFGVITSVTSCIGALQIGAIEDDSEFSIVGSVDGITSMTGGGTVKAGVKGSYKNKNHSKAFDVRTWPVAHNSVQPGKGEVALAYKFTSFDGTMTMPNWVRRKNRFVVTFANNNGGTYVGRCRVEWKRPGSQDTHERKLTVSGGMVGSISDIPLDAYDMKIHIDFASGGDDYYDVPSPITAWPNGTCTVDLDGVWPWGSESSLRVT